MLSALHTATQTAPEWGKAWHHWALFNVLAIDHYAHSDIAAAKRHVAPAVNGFFRSVALGQATGEPPPIMSPTAAQTPLILCSDSMRGNSIRTLSQFLWVVSFFRCSLCLPSIKVIATFLGSLATGGMVKRYVRPLPRCGGCHGSEESHNYRKQCTAFVRSVVLCVRGSLVCAAGCFDCYCCQRRQ